MSEEISFVEEEIIKKDTPAIILGLPDVGLVGIISAEHLVHALKMNKIGYIESDLFPPVTILHKGEIHSPFRIYGNGGFLLITSEIPIPPDILHQFARTVVKWAKSKNARMILALGGTPVPNREDIENPKVYATGSDERAMGIIKESAIEKIEEGVIVGAYATIMWECKKERIPAIFLMAQAFHGYPDPGAAASAVTAASKILDLKVDVKELLEKADEIRLKMRDLMKQTDKTMRTIGKAREYEIPPMYG
ncbi:MAG: PAC2 family protein [Euryarchaeota archaeon]|nr:PAC2 family protein [Euryarchaeota archaeon]